MVYANHDFRRAIALRSTAISVVLCAAHITAAPAVAQSENSSATVDSGQLEEIVVTAQRRSENLQNVPIAVTALSENTLKEANISNVTDLGTVVPALNIVNTNGKLSLSLRGIGSAGFGPGFESPVATYVDGVFIASNVAPFQGMSDVTKVDVLKGPQGTLFGRNATGGLLQITTRIPTEETQLNATWGYGNYQTVQGTAYLAGGLAPGLAASISAYGLHQGEGYGTNRTTGKDTYKIEHSIALRGKLAADLGPSTKAVLSVDYADESRNDVIGVNYPGSVSVFTRQVVPDIGYDQLADAPTFKKSWTAGGSLTLDQDIGALALKSITAYRKAETNVGLDVDMTALPIISSTYRQVDEQFSQELQIGSRVGADLKWVAGLYYFNYDGGYDAIRLPAFNIVTVNYQRAEALAGYAQGTYEFVPNTNFTLGIRYSTETRTEHGGPTPKRDLTFHRVTYRAALDHRFNDQVLGYVSVNTGFKSGGFNTSTPGAPAFSPELVTAYEAGIKTDLFDKRARFNIAAYYYDYKDIQNGIFITPTAVAIQNAASAKVYGVDADFQIRPVDRLEIDGGFSVGHPKFGTYNNAPIGAPGGGVPPVPGSAKGNYLPLAAKYTANLAFTYKAPVAAGELAMTVNGSYNSGYYFEADNIARQPKFALVGANINWTSESGQLSIGAFIRNITDQHIISHSTTNATGNMSFVRTAPRTYGLTMGFKL